MLQWAIANTLEMNGGKESQKRNKRNKEEADEKFKTEKYNNQSKKLSQWAEEQNGGETGKNQWTGKENNWH